jgi:hypothetical protein
VLDVPGVPDAGALYQQALDLGVCDGPVFDAARYDEHLAWREVLDVIAEFDPESAAQGHEELVLVFV